MTWPSVDRPLTGACNRARTGAGKVHPFRTGVVEEPAAQPGEAVSRGEPRTKLSNNLLVAACWVLKLACSGRFNTLVSCYGIIFFVRPLSDLKHVGLVHLCELELDDV